MIKKVKRNSAALFVRDRSSYILTGIAIIALGVTIMKLDKARLSKGINDTDTPVYFMVVSLFFIGVWLAVDYIRQRTYYRQVSMAIEHSGEMQATAMVHSTVTQEQRLVARLLEQQRTAYLNELRSYYRQQEMHNHFVLQWVHNMKTPVSVMDLLMQEASQQMPYTEQEQHQLISNMKDEADRMTRGLEMLLYSARLDKFEMDLHSKQVPLHELIRDVIIAHKRLCIRHSITPNIVGEAWIETDMKWLTFVLNQLVSNAIKYSKGKSGPKRLTFQIEQSASEVKLTIVDEGIGIPPHDLPRIFDPFFTGENGRSVEESTGMGLYLAKQVCDRLGHNLTVRSEVGKGTTFIVAFEPRSIHRLESNVTNM
ncbi:sensor histidine kinase [Paenibacillus sp. SC116]|uniref:sensor histidine kinase n=1 Tax=Paenibacillus sp. SC116 TaxID=2968986 RepID=UPI00215AB69C|nr:sensor histidine kinase [Paenibacillus sp. SC116]MCR8842302.1 sensor histidine kinase [Paenibacillus sp. SC116]